MKKSLILIFTSLVLLTIFTLLLRYMRFIDTKPDIILIMVIYIAIAFDRPSDIFIAFILGYIFDVFSGSPGGLFAMMRTVTFVVVRFLNMNFFSKNALFFIIITFIISIIDSIYLGYQFDSFESGFITIFLNALYFALTNALTAIWMYPLLLKIEEIYLKTLQEA